MQRGLATLQIDHPASGLEAINDFVVKFANVNGSGSASANGLFAKSVLRMGVPVAARNIFPSNIQGLPTWFEVRVSGEGWLGRRGGVDLMVAMNPQTWTKDIASIEPGGYLLYDSTKALPHDGVREDLTLLGVPLTAMCNAAYTDPRQRQLFKNIIYVGALTAMLGIEAEVVDGLIAEQFQGKDRLIRPNLEALAMGRDAAAPLIEKVRLKVERADAVGDRIYVEGNEAAGLGAVYGGATVCAWYPITPSTSLAESFMAYCDKFRRSEDGTRKAAIVQAEDEIASIGVVIGAGWNGSRAFTCTSGPGISLMQEFVGLSYFAEVPAVIFDVQRGGPSTGMPTRTQQSDILLAAYASHGDTKHPLLFPEDPTECFEFGALSFDLADRLQTTVFVMLDLDIGMNDWLCRPFQWDESRRMDRGKVADHDFLDSGAEWGRYRDVDGDGIPVRTLPGTHPTRGGYFTRGTSRDPDARYSEEGSVYVANMERLLRKFETAKGLIPAPVLTKAHRTTPYGAIYYGSTSPAMSEALATLEEEGMAVDALRVRGFPFSDAVMEFIAEHETVFVVEQNRDAQLRSMLMIEGDVDPAKLVRVLNYDGSPITARFITAEIADRLRGATHERAPAASIGPGFPLGDGDPRDGPGDMQSGGRE